MDVFKLLSIVIRNAHLGSFIIIFKFKVSYVLECFYHSVLYCIVI